MGQFAVSTTQRKQVMDITELVTRQLPAGSGVCHVFVAHTTAAVTTADLDPGTDLDMLDAFAAMIPKLAYRHPHNPDHVTDHIVASVIGPSVSMPFADGKLLLGAWQRVVLVELDGPRERKLTVTAVATRL